MPCLDDLTVHERKQEIPTCRNKTQRVSFIACVKTECWENYYYTLSQNRSTYWIYACLYSVLLFDESLSKVCSSTCEQIFSSLSILNKADLMKSQVIFWDPTETQVILCHCCSQNSSIASLLIHRKAKVITVFCKGLDLCCPIQ